MRIQLAIIWSSGAVHAQAHEFLNRYRTHGQLVRVDRGDRRCRLVGGSVTSSTSVAFAPDWSTRVISSNTFVLILRGSEVRFCVPSPPNTELF
ncbi:unnamed protein product [Leptosia nina]|uniref:Secreted protein n=1 Tax=Leptosia nina TaxID=320188 RepID=A0AAV1J3M6_9NEOP